MNSSRKSSRVKSSVYSMMTACCVEDKTRIALGPNTSRIPKSRCSEDSNTVCWNEKVVCVVVRIEIMFIVIFQCSYYCRFRNGWHGRSHVKTKSLQTVHNTSQLLRLSCSPTALAGPNPISLNLSVGGIHLNRNIPFSGVYTVTVTHEQDYTWIILHTRPLS